MSAQYLKDKAREIAYALFRVSFYVKRPDLRNRLDSLAVELLEVSAKAGVDPNAENINHALAAVSALDGLIRLGHSIYEVEPVNATILVRELDNLNSAIRQFGNLPFGEALPNIDSLFSSPKNEVYDIPAQTINLQEQGNNQTSSYPEKVDLNEFEDFEVQDSASKRSGNGLNTAIRQAAIINRIKSSNSSGCRLKDLLAEFPDVSERTVRYDLQRLCEQGIIERVGNGGPASYYIFKGSIIPETQKSEMAPASQ
jgi:hypothetical protein